MNTATTRQQIIYKTEPIKNPRLKLSSKIIRFDLITWISSLSLQYWSVNDIGQYCNNEIHKAIAYQTIKEWITPCTFKCSLRMVNLLLFLTNHVKNACRVFITCGWIVCLFM